MSYYNLFSNFNTTNFDNSFSSWNFGLPSFFNYNSFLMFDWFDFSNVFPKTFVMNTNNNIWNSQPTFNFTSAPKVNFTGFNKKVSGNINNGYLNLTKSAAFAKAKTDSNLEQLTGGRNWSISEASFRTDIPFAKKGTGAILDKVAALTGENLVITSALGTGEANNPHQKSGYASHHNAENPKLDIRINGNAQTFAQKLRDTGYFSRVSVESDHLDVQIDPAKFKGLDTVA